MLQLSNRRTQPPAKGFAPPKIEQQPKPRIKYRVELKRRMRDDSELELGELIFDVPDLKNRNQSDDLAVLLVGAWLRLTEEAKNKGVNQAFVFRAKHDTFVERLELQEFIDANQCVKITISEPLERAKNLLSQCHLISLEWTSYAQNT